MNLRRVLVQRVAIGLFTIWSVLTGVFLVFRGTKNWRLSHLVSIAEYGQATEEEINQIRESYFARRGLDRPLFEQYVDWMTDMLTLQWGRSFHTGEHVRPMIVNGTITTGTYVIPAILLAVCIALLIGVYTALHDGTRRDRALRSVTYFGLGLPNFWIGAFVLAASSAVYYSSSFRGGRGAVRDMPFLYDTVLPILLLSTTLVAAITSYARAYAVEFESADVAKFVRAKGGDTVDVARHSVRNAAIPLVSITFAEIFALLALSVFIMEAMLGIDGLGLVVYNAIWVQDLPVVLGATCVIVAVSVLGNMLQDILYARLDPRVDTGTR